jgi:hypothetical protein
MACAAGRATMCDTWKKDHIIDSVLHGSMHGATERIAGCSDCGRGDHHRQAKWKEISATDIAADWGTINYEVICGWPLACRAII